MIISKWICCMWKNFLPQLHDYLLLLHSICNMMIGVIMVNIICWFYCHEKGFSWSSALFKWTICSLEHCAVQFPKIGNKEFLLKHIKHIDGCLIISHQVDKSPNNEGGMKEITILSVVSPPIMHIIISMP